MLERTDSRGRVESKNEKEVLSNWDHLFPYGSVFWGSLLTILVYPSRAVEKNLAGEGGGKQKVHVIFLGPSLEITSFRSKPENTD